jgi:flagellar biosynthesis/type III secretory pathway protein FliH
MSFVALHRGAHTSLASDTVWLEADEVTQVAHAQALLERLDRLVAARTSELAAAREQGLAEGRECGRREALAAVAPKLIDAWDQAARSAAADLDALRGALVTLSLQVVQRIAGELGPAALIASIAEQAAEALLPASAAVVRVHPEVAAAVRERIAPAPGVLEVRADPGLGRFDCVFDTPAGQRLAGLPAQLERLAAVWQEAST